MQIFAIFALIILLLFSYYLGRVKGYLQAYDNLVKSFAQEKRKTFLEEQRRKNHDKGLDLSVYFTNRGITKMVIFGCEGGYYHEFLEDLNISSFDKMYLADSNAKYMKDKGDKVYDTRELKELDFQCIVVTSISHFTEIKKTLRRNGIDKPIVGYSDLVFNLQKEVCE